MPDVNLIPPGSLVLAWNSVYLDTVRQIGGAPGPLARIGALMHLAMYQTVSLLVANAYPKGWTAPVPVPPAAPDPATSAAYAAACVLQAAVPAYVKSLLASQGGVPTAFGPFQVLPGAAAHAQALAAPNAFAHTGPGLQTAGATNDPDAAAKDAAAKTFGNAVVEALLTKFPADTCFGMTASPTFDGAKGEWRPTGSGTALTPEWGHLPLFSITPGSQPAQHYQPTAIPKSLLNYTALLASPFYAAQVREVQRLGGVHSAERTPEQTEIAFFWANDLNGTSKPPGQLYTITQTVAKQQGTLKDNSAEDKKGLLETARLFALVGTAMVNASIVAWQAKYFGPDNSHPMRLWRPESAIQLAGTVGNSACVADPDWQPLSPMKDGTRFSPNFPAYVSGHSTFGAAWAAAMGGFFGTDNVPFVATTEDPHATRDANGVRRTRSFTSFTQAAVENGRSRVYLGVHYQCDADGGYQIGHSVGTATVANFMAPKPPEEGRQAASA
jgi:hypothetical protein